MVNISNPRSIFNSIYNLQTKHRNQDTFTVGAMPLSLLFYFFLYISYMIGKHLRWSCDKTKHTLVLLPKLGGFGTRMSNS